ncbi:AAA family ATPase [Streptomyces sp. NPDC002835]
MGAWRLNSRFLQLSVENFRTLTRVRLPLGPLTVLVGPNAAGKSNLLRAFEFLADVANVGIESALTARGGYQEVAYRGGDRTLAAMRITLEGIWTDHASDVAPDTYSLTLMNRRLPSSPHGTFSLSRREQFILHTEPDAPSVIRVLQETAEAEGPTRTAEHLPARPKLSRWASGLEGALPLAQSSSSAAAVKVLAGHLASVRIFDADVRAARRPAAVGFPGQLLANDASNLADFLLELQKDSDAWTALLEDATTLVPSIEDIYIRPAPGSHDRVTVQLKERGLRGSTQLADASFGTVRILCLLALLHDPHPPVLTCIEEIDHGLHPHALALLADRLREASDRTQFLVSTHAPVFVDQLEPEEFIVCERDEKGASLIPAISTERIHAIVDASEGLPLGELWFSGTLGGIN